MLKADSTAMQASLEKAKQEIKKKLEYMIASFARDVTAAASESTPVGDSEAIVNKPSYRNFYLQRFKDYQIEADIGFHAGAWVYSEDQNYEFDRTIYTNEQAEGTTFATAKANYRLGEDFYIQATGPGYSALNSGYSPKAPEGIIKPTVQLIESTYRINLKAAYDKG